MLSDDATDGVELQIITRIRVILHSQLSDGTGRIVAAKKKVKDLPEICCDVHLCRISSAMNQSALPFGRR
jgi:hypothetical protein